MSDRPSAALGAALSETACVSPPIHPSTAPVRPPTRRLRLADIGQRRREQRGARRTPGHASNKAIRTPQEAASRVRPQLDHWTGIGRGAGPLVGAALTRRDGTNQQAAVSISARWHTVMSC